MTPVLQTPQELEDERYLLGAILLDSTLLPEVSAFLKPTDLYSPVHANLFRFLQNRSAAGESNDLGVVGSILMSLPKKKQQEFGGADYVMVLPNHCPSVEGGLPIAKKVKAGAIRREVIIGAMKLIEQAKDPLIDIHALTASVEGLASQIGGNAPTADWATLEEALNEAMDDTTKRMYAHRENRPVGIPTGLPELSAITGPLEPGQLWIIAGRPAMGKSALAMQIAVHVATEGYGAAIVSLEMSRTELAKRQLSSESGVWSEKIRDGTVTDYDMQALDQAYQKIYKLPIWIQDSSVVAITMLKSKLKRLMVQAEKRGTPLKVVVVDYLQLVETLPGQQRQEAIAAISRSLKAMAGQLGITIIAVSQLNRDCEQRTDKRPLVSDLRESGAIEQDANKIVFVYRDEVYSPGTNVGKAEIIVAKNREGKTLIAHVKWDGSTTSFRSIECTH